MKKIFLLFTLFTVVILTATFNSCSKSIIEQNLTYPALKPVREDANAGTWKPILLTSADEFTCAAPIATTTPDYIIQVNEIKSLQASITDDERDLVHYWGAGAVLRWNEIMRELVAKHNLPPYQNDDGTYPIPSANNPLAYPTFPFSNPPYAARAYAYLSAAQYDALVATYHYKATYNRPAPFNVDSSLQTLLPKSTLGSYPSEDAAVEGASVEILKLLFPGDQDYIIQRAEEHRRARLISGANVRSDLDAGEALGKLVAGKFVARARTDKAGAAVGNATIWADLKQSAITRGETPWISQELPERPPMLPMFGKVKTFLFDSATLVNSVRPPAPPSTTSQQFRTELEEVYQTTKNLSREQLRVADFWADGLRTYTPPGHWNYIAANDFVYEYFSEPRWARNMALLNMAIMDAGVACWDAKTTYFSPRPMQMDSRIKTGIGLPNFPSYIFGHSTFSGAAASVLGYIIPAKAQGYLDMATEASVSRMYGGIHYRSDCEVGITTGKKVASYAIERGHIDGAE